MTCAWTTKGWGWMQPLAMGRRTRLKRQNQSRAGRFRWRTRANASICQFLCYKIRRAFEAAPVPAWRWRRGWGEDQVSGAAVKERTWVRRVSAVACIAVALTACGQNRDIESLGDSVFATSARGYQVDAQRDVIRRAEAFCEAKGLQLRVDDLKSPETMGGVLSALCPRGSEPTAGIRRAPSLIPRPSPVGCQVFGRHYR